MPFGVVLLPVVGFVIVADDDVQRIRVMFLLEKVWARYEMAKHV